MTTIFITAAIIIAVCSFVYGLAIGPLDPMSFRMFSQRFLRCAVVLTAVISILILGVDYVRIQLFAPVTIKIKTSFPVGDTNAVWAYDPDSDEATNASILAPMNTRGRWKKVTNNLAQ